MLQTSRPRYKVGERRTRVRKLIAFELVSVDGVAGTPNEWAFSYSDEEMEKENEAGMESSDALLLDECCADLMPTTPLCVLAAFRGAGSRTNRRCRLSPSPRSGSSAPPAFSPASGPVRRLL